MSAPAPWRSGAAPAAGGLPGNTPPEVWLERLQVVADRMTRPPGEPEPAAATAAERLTARQRAAAHGRRALGLAA